MTRFVDTRSAGPYAAQVIADGASHYWRLGEASGTVAADQVGGAPGTISGGVTLGAAGPLADGSKAMSFDGTSGKIATAAAVLLPVTLTLEWWLINTGTAVQTILGDYPVAAGGALAVQVSGGGGAIGLYSPVGGSTTGGSFPPDGHWHHFAVTWNGSTATFYVDGVPLDIPAAFARTASANDVFVLGALTNNSTWLAGSLAEVAIYPVALTPAQIANHYALRTAVAAATTHDANTRCQTYLVTTAYAGTASTDFGTNLSRWLRDGSQPGASTQDATQRFQQLLKNSA